MTHRELIAIGVALMLSGCDRPAMVGPVLTLDQAVDLVEGNRRLVVTGLKAQGSVRGYFRDADEARRSFDLSGRLQVLPPERMRFVMEHLLSGPEVEVGMNPDKWWVVVQRPQEHYYEGGLGSSTMPLGDTIPLRADQLMECLGLSRLSANDPAQRIEPSYQQLIYVDVDFAGHVKVQKEYWLDRAPPRLVRRVLFRDDEGRVMLSSELSQYRTIDDRGLMLPHKVHIRWPLEDAEMTYSITRWRADSRLNAEHRAFVSPLDRGNRYEHETLLSN